MPIRENVLTLNSTQIQLRGFRTRAHGTLFHKMNNDIMTRGGVEDTRLEAKAKDTRKIRGQGQGQPFRGQALSKPRTGMLET